MKSLGIIGGLGPMATAYLLQLIIEMTDAKVDQQHLDVAVLNRPDVPDRTAYILDHSKPSPLPILLKSLRDLEALGAEYICTPCVTAHFFYEELRKNSSVPIINMVAETGAELIAEGKKRIGIMATTGTVSTGLFQAELSKLGLETVLPSKKSQRLVMELIYDDIKAGRPADMEKLKFVSDELFSENCDCLILGCTELSLIKKAETLGHGYLDALEVLAKRCVELCGAQLKAQYKHLIT